MKKLYYLSVVAVCATIVGCTNSLDGFVRSESIGVVDPSVFERYSPKGEVVSITLANGAKVCMDTADSVYFAGDMVLAPELIEALSISTTKGAVIGDYEMYWPNKTIPYYVSSDFTTSERNVIRQALNEIELVADLSFVQQTTYGVGVIRFVHSTDGVNYSPVGKQGNRANTIELVSNCAKGSILHEVMHSLGYFHEHCRTDRDQYVTIYEDNIQENFFYAFEKYIDEYAQGGYDLGTLDFNSIMMYGSTAFRKKGCTGYSMTKKDGSTFYGQRSGLSDGDKAALYYIYGPKPVITTTETYYEDNSDDQSRDERSVYSNVLSFVDDNNNPVTLLYPRVIWTILKHDIMFQNGDTGSTSDVITKLVLPAGTSSYILPNTEYIYQDDMGVPRYRYRSYYTTRYY